MPFLGMPSAPFQASTVAEFWDVLVQDEWAIGLPQFEESRLRGVSFPEGQRLTVLSGPAARLSQRYPPIARYGVFGVSTWPIGCDTPSPFSERFPLGEHTKWRCDTPP